MKKPPRIHEFLFYKFVNSWRKYIVLDFTVVRPDRFLKPVRSLLNIKKRRTAVRLYDMRCVKKNFDILFQF